MAARVLLSVEFEGQDLMGCVSPCPMTLEDEGTSFVRIVKTSYQVTRCHITEDLDPKLGSCLTENLLRLDYEYCLTNLLAPEFLFFNFSTPCI